jgi:hypothetical protein
MRFEEVVGTPAGSREFWDLSNVFAVGKPLRTQHFRAYLVHFPVLACPAHALLDRFAGALSGVGKTGRRNRANDLRTRL